MALIEGMGGEQCVQYGRQVSQSIEYSAKKKTKIVALRDLLRIIAVEEKNMLDVIIWIHQMRYESVRS